MPDFDFRWDYSGPEIKTYIKEVTMPDEERERLLQEHSRAWMIANDFRFGKEYRETHLRIARALERKLGIAGEVYNG